MRDESASSDKSMSLDTRRWVDDACLAFESAWKAGQHPKIEQFVAKSSPQNSVVLLRELLTLEVEYRRRAGEAPTVDEYRRRFRGHETVVEVVFHTAATVQLSQPAVGVGESTIEHVRRASRRQTPPSVFGDYELQEELGAGGMGVVYKARQRSADRMVALKLIRSDRLDGGGPEQHRATLDRFRNESQAAARLEHEHIVTVYEVGEVDGRPFYSMQYVQGQSLAEIIHDGPIESRRAARFMEPVARAVHAAHQHGVLHRDLKPRNILVDAETTCPLVADFGLAKLLEGGRDVTVTGQVFGSPPYMSPEQALDSARATIASDVYSLGATLYHLLTGRPPFQAPTAPEILRKVIDQQPVAPQQLNPAVDRDLETICVKCLEKSSSQRYESAAALADDLRRFLNREPILARPVSIAERFWRWCRRNPVVAFMTLAAAGFLVLGICVSSYFAVEANQRADEAHQQEASARHQQGLAKAASRDAKSAQLAAERAQAEEAAQRRNAEYNFFLRQVALAQQKWLNCDLPQAEKLLKDCPESMRHWEWYYLKQICRPKVMIFGGHRASVGGVSWNPTGEHLVSAGDGGYAIIWNRRTGEEVRRILNRTLIWPVAFSHDGRYIAFGDVQGIVKLFDAKSGDNVFSIKGHRFWTMAMTFTHDGSRLISASGLSGIIGRIPDHPGFIKIWDVPSGKEMLKLQHDAVCSVATSPDDRWLVSTSRVGTVKLWDISKGTETRTLMAGPTALHMVTFAPDGCRVGIAGHDGIVRVWNVETGDVEIEMNRRSAEAIDFSPDGRHLAIGQDCAVMLLDARTGQELRTFRGHTRSVRDVKFSPDGHWLASAARDAKVIVWDVSQDQESRVVKAYDAPCTAVGIDGSGKVLASASADGRIQVWNLEKLALHCEFGKDDAPLYSIAVSPDGELVASGHEDGQVRVWKTKDGSHIESLKVSQHKVRAVAFNNKGTRLTAAGTGAKVASVWDTESWQPVCTYAGHGPNTRFSDLCFSPNGKRIASADNSMHRREGCSLRLWDAETGADVTLLGRGAPESFGEFRGVAFSPNGDRIVASGHDRVIRMWDANTYEEKFSLAGHTAGIADIVFVPDGTRIISVDIGNTIKIWDAMTGKEVISMGGYPGRFTKLAISRDGRRLVAANADGTLRIWQVEFADQ